MISTDIDTGIYSKEILTSLLHLCCQENSLLEIGRTIPIPHLKESTSTFSLRIEYFLADIKIRVFQTKKRNSHFIFHSREFFQNRHANIFFVRPMICKRQLFLPFKVHNKDIRRSVNVNEKVSHVMMKF